MLQRENKPASLIIQVRQGSLLIPSTQVTVVSPAQTSQALPFRPATPRSIHHRRTYSFSPSAALWNAVSVGTRPLPSLLMLSYCAYYRQIGKIVKQNSKFEVLVTSSRLRHIKLYQVDMTSYCSLYAFALSAWYCGLF